MSGSNNNAISMHANKWVALGLIFSLCHGCFQNQNAKKCQCSRYIYYPTEGQGRKGGERPMACRSFHQKVTPISTYGVLSGSTVIPPLPKIEWDSFFCFRYRWKYRFVLWIHQKLWCMCCCMTPKKIADVCYVLNPHVHFEESFCSTCRIICGACRFYLRGYDCAAYGQ